MTPRVTSAVLAARRVPMPAAPMNRPASRPAQKYITAAEDSTAPSAAWGRPNVSRMDGQATPSTASGSPRLTKARYASTRRAGRGRTAAGTGVLMAGRCPEPPLHAGTDVVGDAVRAERLQVG